MLEVPAGLNLIFILTTLATYIFFIAAMFANGASKNPRYINFVAILLMLWLIFQSTLALNQWFMDRKSMPPHLFFPLITSIIVLTMTFALKKSKNWVSQLNAPILTWLHIVRIPVEIGLYQLAFHKQLPWSMTFNGFNFDILFGITAPIVALLYYKFKIINTSIVRIWHYLGLISVLAVVVQGVGSLPSPIQWWQFSQPNYAVMHFPFVWLPSFIVPIVVFSHIAVLQQLKKS